MHNFFFVTQIQIIPDYLHYEHAFIQALRTMKFRFCLKYIVVGLAAVILMLDRQEEEKS